MTVSRKNSRISQKQKCEKGLQSGPYLQSIHEWTCAIISRIYFELRSSAMMGCEVASESDRISKCSVIVLHVHTEACGALQSLAFSINHFMPEFEVSLNRVGSGNRVNPVDSLISHFFHRRIVNIHFAFFDEFCAHSKICEKESEVYVMTSGSSPSVLQSCKIFSTNSSFSFEGLVSSKRMISFPL